MPTAAILGPDPNNPLSMAMQQTVVTQQKMPRATDRLEVREFLEINAVYPKLPTLSTYVAFTITYLDFRVFFFFFQIRVRSVMVLFY